MVFRDRRPPRHRAADVSTADAQPADELESYLAAISPEADIPGVFPESDLTERFGSAQVFQVRLPAAQIEQLRRLAEARGVPPTSLIVDWVLERLDREDPASGLPPSGGGMPVANPLDHLNPVGELTSVDAETSRPSPVTPLFGAAHAARPPDSEQRQPRHRAPEPVTSLHTRRKF